MWGMAGWKEDKGMIDEAKTQYNASESLPSTGEALLESPPKSLPKRLFLKGDSPTHGRYIDFISAGFYGETGTLLRVYGELAEDPATHIDMVIPSSSFLGMVSKPLAKGMEATFGLLTTSPILLCSSKEAE